MYILCWQSSLTFFVDIFTLAHHKGVLMALSISIRFDSLLGSYILYIKKIKYEGLRNWISCSSNAVRHMTCSTHWTMWVHPKIFRYTFSHGICTTRDYIDFRAFWHLVVFCRTNIS